MTQFKNYKNGDVLTKADYDAISNALNAKWGKTVNIEPGKTVYFDKAVQISRNEFKKQYLENKIVHSLSKADYYVSNEKPHFWFSFHNVSHITLDSNSWRVSMYLDKMNLAIDYINGNSKIVSPTSIKFKAANDDLPKEMVDKIQQMLQSPDVETLNLGMTILFEYDHEKCLDQFYLLLAKANHISFWRRKKTRVIEQKIKFIKSKFSNHRF